MVRSQASRRRSLAALTAVLTVTGSLLSGPAAGAPGHTTVVSATPSSLTPDILDGTVFAIHDAGAKVIVGGSFTQARSHNSDTVLTRNWVLAFDKATGVVDSGFAPTVDGQVNAIVAGPTADTVFLAGQFNTVNGVTRRKLALVRLSDGGLVTSFQGPAFNGLVNDVTRAGDRLLVGGIFTTAGSANPRGGLASLNVSTGALDSYLTVGLTGHHNWDGVSGAQAGVGAEKLALSPDGRRLVVIGNFKNANGVPHDQIVKLDLGDSTATIADWNTSSYTPRCSYWAFDSYMRDVTFAPDGSYFVVVTTGGPHPGTLCDTAARWESNATGAAVRPTWVNASGGDTFLSVGVSEQAIYVGGHLRYLNNSSGTDSAKPGAVGRASIAALDPVSGLPLAWNPGRHPRGYGVAEMVVTPEGIWLGSDQPWIGNFQYRRERIAFFPLTGGAAPHSTATATLPGHVYQAGNVTSAGIIPTVVRTGNRRPTPIRLKRVTSFAANDMVVRGYDGASTAGTALLVPNSDGTAWSTAKGAFWVGGTLFYGMNGALYRRSFDGTTLGTPRLVDPYHDAYWDTVETDAGPAGQTYAGSTVNFYPEIVNVTGMFYTAGRLYYTLSGQSGLFWRWFTPDSGIVGADKFTVAGATGFADAGGVFVSGGTLYLVSRSTGNLSTVAWVNGAPSGTPVVRSGPAIDGADWRGKAVFVGP